MKTTINISIIATLLFASCSSGFYANSGSYDDAYYKAFALYCFGGCNYSRYCSIPHPEVYLEDRHESQKRIKLNFLTPAPHKPRGF